MMLRTYEERERERREGWREGKRTSERVVSGQVMLCVLPYASVCTDVLLFFRGRSSTCAYLRPLQPHAELRKCGEERLPVLEYARPSSFVTVVRVDERLKRGGWDDLCAEEHFARGVAVSKGGWDRRRVEKGTRHKWPQLYVQVMRDLDSHNT
jgi:hypothetical protein